MPLPANIDPSFIVADHDVVEYTDPSAADTPAVVSCAVNDTKPDDAAAVKHCWISGVPVT